MIFSHLLTWLEGIIILDQIISVSIVFLNELCNIFFVEDVLASLVDGKVHEVLILSRSESDTLRSEQLFHNVLSDVAVSLGVKNLEGGHKMFCRIWLIFVGDKSVKHEWLKLVEFDVVTGFVSL